MCMNHSVGILHCKDRGADRIVLRHYGPVWLSEDGALDPTRRRGPEPSGCSILFRIGTGLRARACRSRVIVTSNADSVELRLNGRLVDKVPVDKYQMVTFEMPYEAGLLEAIASKGDERIARFAVETTDSAAALRLVPDRVSLAGDGEDAETVTIGCGCAGTGVPSEENEVQFSVDGLEIIIALKNGDPTNHVP